jgi:replication-associated recombination protein RarA
MVRSNTFKLVLANKRTGETQDMMLNVPDDKRYSALCDCRRILFLAAEYAERIARNRGEDEKLLTKEPTASEAGRQLVEHYRPRRLTEIVGQSKAVTWLTRFAMAPRRACLLFHGPTGTGKTSAALALAAEIGVSVEQTEAGGLHNIPAGEQSPDNIRDKLQAIHLTPMWGSGWRVLIVNECDKMSPAVDAMWQDILESQDRLPKRCVVIFTTNYPDKLSQRFRDRCTTFQFAGNNGLVAATKELIGRVALTETGRALPKESLDEIMDSATSQDGQVSVRAALQALQVMV